MAVAQPIEDIVRWSDEKLPSWQQDALRRFACGGFAQEDAEELLAMVKHKAGLKVASSPPASVPLAASHFAGAVGSAPLRLVGVRAVANVNRLVPGARLDFAANGITLVFGRNGSGKSGFVRILRTACRTRVEKPDKLRVLANVYGAVTGPQSAEIVINAGAGEVAIPWTSASGPSPELLQVAVFDSAAASLYVDHGHQIRFLPFGLALPHKLNELCLSLKGSLETERQHLTQQLALAVVTFETFGGTKAQIFYRGLNAATTDQQIDAAAVFTEDNVNRMDEIRQQLAASPESSTDLQALASACEAVTDDCERIALGLDDKAIEAGIKLAQDAKDKRQAARLDAGHLFKDEPLPGVGAGVWRALWAAARDYSVKEAYPDRDFPVGALEGEAGACVLCQQPLGDEAADRMRRFAEYMDGSLTAAAEAAEGAVRTALETLSGLGALADADWPRRAEQIKARDEDLAERLQSFKTAAEQRRMRLQAILTGRAPPTEPVSELSQPGQALKTLAARLSADAEARAKAGEDAVRVQLQAELLELADLKLLSSHKDRLKIRRDLLKTDAAYGTALREVQTSAITTAANRFVDEHLTQKVVDQFERERNMLEIDHLKIGITRKSGRTEAAFQTDPRTSVTKSASDILSEGEQRALALSAFMTEVTMTEGPGPIVIDDPVSSMDRERCVRVAMRLAQEAQKRQVVVFTHDLVFFNDMCREAEAAGVPVESVAIFADQQEAGKVDPAGLLWKGLAVAKRINVLMTEWAKVKPLSASSPAEYEYALKNIYGRLRDTYERAVEECIFYDVITRGADRIETMKLRYVHLTDALAIRFHEGMTRANTFSHDNPAAETVKAPTPAEFEADLASFEQLIKDIRDECKQAETRRPTMVPKK